MMRALLKPVPSKFGVGVSLLWRGNKLSLLNGYIRQNLFSRKHGIAALPGDTYLFESARSAIYNCLASKGIGAGDEVVVSSFTCEAVTYAVLRTGARPVYVDVNDDLTMCDESVLSALNSSTRAVIMQNTFGRLGLRQQTLDQLRQQKLFIIEDCALSIGSQRSGIPLGEFGDVSVWSLEVSKTVTIGWGGVAKANDPTSAEALSSRYQTLGSISMVADLRRLFQLWFSVLMMHFTVPGAGAIWYFMYGSRIFRRSNNFAQQHPTKYEKMGTQSAKLFGYMQPRLAEVFLSANRNYLELQEEASRLGLIFPIAQTKGEMIVAPRFSVHVSPEQIDALVRYGDSAGVEVGRWFSECPPEWGKTDCLVHSSENAQRLSKVIVNLPCHWSLTADDLKKVKGILSYMAGIK